MGVDRECWSIDRDALPAWRRISSGSAFDFA